MPHEVGAFKKGKNNAVLDIWDDPTKKSLIVKRREATSRKRDFPGKPTYQISKKWESYLKGMWGNEVTSRRTGLYRHHKSQNGPANLGRGQ